MTNLSGFALAALIVSTGAGAKNVILGENDLQYCLGNKVIAYPNQAMVCYVPKYEEICLCSKSNVDRRKKIVTITSGGVGTSD